MQIIAHRGSNKEHLENSVSAYEAAVECGAHRIELDIQLSRDGQPFINHDDHLMHTTGKDLYCSAMDSAELRQISLLNSERLPELATVVERFLPRIELNIELKGNDPRSAQATLDVLKNSKYRDKVIVSCFFPEPLRYMRDHAPDIQRACLVGDDEIHWPFFSHMACLNFMRDVDAHILHPRMEMVGANLMDQAQHRGWKVYSWSTMVGENVAAQESWTTLKSLGVHGHCTNYPREMKQWLKEIDEHEQRARKLF